MQTETILIILIAALSVAVGYGLYWITRLRSRFEAAFANLDSKENLATTITDYYKKIGASEKKLAQINKNYQQLTKIAAKSLQKTALIKFNPFRDTGGKQSFVLALLDNHDSGIVLTSIHSRDGTRVYVKHIEYGGSQQQLSQEETEALKQARGGKNLIKEL